MAGGGVNEEGHPDRHFERNRQTSRNRRIRTAGADARPGRYSKIPGTPKARPSRSLEMLEEIVKVSKGSSSSVSQAVGGSRISWGTRGIGALGAKVNQVIDTGTGP